jgi:hypothetical protein
MESARVPLAESCWRNPQGCAADRRRPARGPHALRRSDPATAGRASGSRLTILSADAGGAQRPETPRRRSRSRTNSGSSPTRSAGRSPDSGASSAASPAPANGTASRSSTITATTRSRSTAVLKPRGPHRGAGDRGCPAAPLHTARLAVQRVLHLLQRRRRGDRRARLCGRRDSRSRGPTGTASSPA